MTKLCSSGKVKLYGICSERQPDTNKAFSDWNLSNYTSIIGDDKNLLVRYIRDAYLPKLHVTDCSRDGARSPELSVKNFPNGAVQPAVLFFVATKPALGWACVPTAANLQGSLGRPDPGAVWRVVEECKAMDDEGKAFEMNDGEDLPRTVTFGQACKTCCHCIIL